MDKTAMGHLHNGILLGHNKEENFTLCNSMDGLENIMLREIRQSEEVCSLFLTPSSAIQTNLAKAFIF